MRLQILIAKAQDSRVVIAVSYDDEKIVVVLPLNRAIL